MRRSARTYLSIALACLVVAVVAVPALAHETKEAGGYSFVVGWGLEPAYVGQMNSVQLIVTHKADGDPVNDPGARLSVTVSYGSAETKMALTPTWSGDLGTGTPGEYRALLIPTAPGDYTFHVTGTIGGVKVDEKVTSSPKTFSPVEDAAEGAVPQQGARRRADRSATRRRAAASGHCRRCVERSVGRRVGSEDPRLRRHRPRRRRHRRRDRCSDAQASVDRRAQAGIRRTAKCPNRDGSAHNGSAGASGGQLTSGRVHQRRLSAERRDRRPRPPRHRRRAR